MVVLLTMEDTDLEALDVGDNCCLASLQTTIFKLYQFLRN